MKQIAKVSLLTSCFVAVIWFSLATRLHAPTTTDGTVSISGSLGCLPHKGSGPQTMECAYGLKADNNTWYALSLSDGNIYEYTSKEQLVVTGTLTPADTNETYDIIGTIAVDTISYPRS